LAWIHKRKKNPAFVTARRPMTLERAPQAPRAPSRPAPSNATPRNKLHLRTPGKQAPAIAVRTNLDSSSSSDDDDDDPDAFFESSDDCDDDLMFRQRNRGRQTGREEYLAECLKLKIVPSSYILSNLESDVVNVSHRYTGSRSAVALGECMKANRFIRVLSVKDNAIGQIGGFAKAEALAHNPVMLRLELSGNKMGATACVALALALKYNTQLQYLGLAGNGLTSCAANILSAQAGQHPSLTSLDVSDNGVSGMGGACSLGARCAACDTYTCCTVCGECSACGVFVLGQLMQATHAGTYYYHAGTHHSFYYDHLA